jgi:hypothetical protein
MSRNKKYKMKAISSSFSEKGGYSAQFVSDGYSVDARAESPPARKPYVHQFNKVG